LAVVKESGGCDGGTSERALISTLRVVIGQRLVRRLTDSKEAYTLSVSEKTEISKHVNLDVVLNSLRNEGIVKANATWNNIPFYHSKNAGEDDDGYKGRVGIHEILRMSSAIKEIVMANGTADDIEAQARKEGMMTMVEDGIFKAALGQTSIEEVLRVISE